MKSTAPLLLLILLLFSMPGCLAKSTTRFAKVYQETDPVKPGSYRLQFLLDDRDTPAETSCCLGEHLFSTGLTISELHSSGGTFWEVLKKEKEFDPCKSGLDLNQAGFSYTESIANHFSHILMGSDEATSDILIREIVIRLRQKKPFT